MLEVLVRRDRVIVDAGLAGLAILAWLYVLHLAHAMSDLDMHTAMGTAGPQMRSWHLADGLRTFLTWSVMMAAIRSGAPRGPIRCLPLAPTLR